MRDVNIISKGSVYCMGVLITPPQIVVHMMMGVMIMCEICIHNIQGVCMIYGHPIVHQHICEDFEEAVHED